MGTVYAIANQKGGVGTTTTAVNLAACIAEAGYASLLIDMDPQSNATLGLGIDKHTTPTVYDALLDGVPLADTVVASQIPNLGVVPAGPDLAGAINKWMETRQARGGWITAWDTAVWARLERAREVFARRQAGGTGVIRIMDMPRMSIQYCPRMRARRN